LPSLSGSTKAGFTLATSKATLLLPVVLLKSSLFPLAVLLAPVVAANESC